MHSQVEVPILQSTFGLDGHVAVVTGASSGFGAHFAQVLHAAGATVVLVERRADRLKALTDELGDRSLFITVDIGSADARTEIVARTLDEFGRIDILVNNAGISHPGQPRATEESMDEFARVLDVNVSSLFGLCQVAGAGVVGSDGITPVAGRHRNRSHVHRHDDYVHQPELPVLGRTA